MRFTEKLDKHEAKREYIIYSFNKPKQNYIQNKHQLDGIIKEKIVETARTKQESETNEQDMEELGDFRDRVLYQKNSLSRFSTVAVG